MAVNGNLNFQRRNQGLLAETPNFSDVGQSAYVDYAAGDAEKLLSQPSPMRQAVKEADVAPAALAGPQTPEAMAEYEAAQTAALQRAEEAALRQRQSVKNPLNVVGNAISAVVGTPFRLLENAVGGGNNDLAAPFRPNAMAQDRYQATYAGIQAAKLKLAQDMDGLRANQTQAMTNVLTDQSKLRREAQDFLAIGADNATRAADPQATYANFMQRALEDPVFGPQIKKLGYDERPWTKDLARELATSKDIIERIDARGKVNNIVAPFQSTVLQTDDQGKLVNTFQQSVPPAVSPNPQPEPKLPPIPAGFQLEGGPTQPASGTFRAEQ